MVAWTDNLRPPDKIDVAEWAKRNIVLPNTSAEPGPYKPIRTPYLIEILNAFGLRGIATIAMMCSTQIGKSTFEHIALLFGVSQSQGTALFLLPTEDVAVEHLNERIKPMIDSSPTLRKLKSPQKKDWKKNGISINGMRIYVGWAGSEAATQSRACKYVVNDELSIWQQKPNAPDPVQSARERTRTFWDSKELNVSTPKHPNDLIVREWEESDKRRYWVPCPHCGTYQHLEFSRDTVRWPEGATAKEIKLHRLAAYYCTDCGTGIEDESKQTMLERGVWCPEGCTVNRNGEIEGDLPIDTHRGYHLNALYSPWLTFSEVAARFLEALAEGELQAFYNYWLGLPFEESSKSPSVTALEEITKKYDAGTIPAGGLVLTAGVDVQEVELYWSVRAWGSDGESWLVKSGVCTDWDDLEVAVLDYYWPHEDGDPLQVQKLLIDSGYRTDEVIAFCRRNKGRAEPCKGFDTLVGATVQVTRPERTSKGKIAKSGLLLTRVNTDHFKTMIQRKIINPPLTAPWWIHAEPDAVYCKQITSERKVYRKTASGTKSKWVTKPGCKDNHYFDTEVYNGAAAERLGLGYKLQKKTLEKVAEVKEEAAVKKAVEKAGGRPARRGSGGEFDGWGNVDDEW